MRGFKAQQLRQVGGQSGNGARCVGSWKAVWVLSFLRKAQAALRAIAHNFLTASKRTAAELQSGIS